MPMMEKATEKLYFSVSERSVGSERERHDDESFIIFSSKRNITYATQYKSDV